MANIKVVNADQLDADMRSVADAIRDRAGTSGELAWPEGFAEGVRGISTYADCIVARANATITEVVSDKPTEVIDYAFAFCKKLTKVDLPNVTEVKQRGFYNNTNLNSVNLPKVVTINAGAFCDIQQLASCYFPELTTLAGDDQFSYSYKLTKMYLPKITYIEGRTWRADTAFETLVIGSPSVPTLTNYLAFDNTKIAKGTGYIYVPRSLIADGYKKATNWSNFANQFRAIEDYPEVLEGWT